MKVIMQNTVMISAVLLILGIFSLGCNGAQQNGTAEDDFTKESIRGLDKITPQVINDFDFQIQKYLEIAHDPSNREKATEARNNLRIIASAYEIGLLEAIERGDEFQKNTAAMMIGVLNSQIQMKESVPMLVKFVRKGNDNDDLRYRALIGLMLMDKALRYYGFDEEGKVT